MDAKTSIRIITIAMLLFSFLSSAMVVAEPNNVALEAKKKSSLRRIMFQMKTTGKFALPDHGPICYTNCSPGYDPQNP
ncbi:hypothetical protein RGQ29_031452 [Quercus rubra]|uniref:Transmembrane protein n=1 Tax=Quercus rubra TaxID=3512 RepID=A0AAN7EKP1_QUERU|nr:hypothetical protein RGQ29_031452 [Quercus rubra]